MSKTYTLYVLLQKLATITVPTTFLWKCKFNENLTSVTRIKAKMGGGGVLGKGLELLFLCLISSLKLELTV